MRNLRNLTMITLLLIISTTVNSQVLISLVFGDALNTEKIEFGLVGGLNRSYILDIEESKGLNNFNIGFYFHIHTFESSYISTGVLVKSNVGASGMPTYPIGDPEFDSVFSSGELTKKINYFYVPIMWHQRFNNRWYLEGGIQAGLRGNAYDFFVISKEDETYGGEVAYKRIVRDDYAHLDFGFIGGVGYKFRKQVKSVAVGINYYYGLVDVSKVPDVTIQNSSVYFYVKVPIGTNPKEKKDKQP